MTAGEDLPYQAFPPADPAEFAPFGEGVDFAGAEPEESGGDGRPDRSFVDDLRDLAADAQTAIAAEKAYQGARASFVANRGKSIAGLFAAAAGLLYFALIAAVVGLVLALAPLLTAWGALAAVTLTLALAAIVLFVIAMSRLKRMRTVLALHNKDEARP